MRQHRSENGVLMAATACLYNLVSRELAKSVHSRLLASMVELLLGAMETAPNQSQVVISLS